MRIKSKSIELYNILTVTDVLQENEVIGLATHLKKFVVDNNLYPTGPFIYQILEGNEDRNKYKIYLPINRSITLSEDSILSFDERLYIEDGISCRCVDSDEVESTENLLKLFAEKNNLKLKEPFYNIYLEGYGDPVIDVFAEIKG